MSSQPLVMRCFLEAPFLDILLALVLASNTSSYQVQSTCLSCGQLLTGATRPGSKAPFRQEMCKIFEVHCQKKTSFVLCRHISLDLFILPFHLALRPLTNNRPSFISMINYQNRLKKCCRQEIRNFQSLLDFNASCHTPG